MTDVDKSFGATEVLRGIDIDLEPGRSLALLGPSGCGKTTLLRLIAGLDRPDRGSISVGDRPMVGPSVWVPPEKRQVGMVFQDWALFTHLSVAENVGYGLPRGERRGSRVHEALEMVGLDGFGDRLPETLSGGQQQRVALARALAPRPSVLLLDEPFSNLDSALRGHVRSEVHRLLDDLDVTSIMVTHDQTEAFILGDVVGVMRDGRLEQTGTPREVYRSPLNTWIASFVGDVNLLAGDGRGDVAETVLGRLALQTPVSGGCRVLLRPEDLEITPGERWVVTSVEFHGHDTIVQVRLDDDTELTVRAGADDRSSKGDRVDVVYVGEAARAFV